MFRFLARRAYRRMPAEDLIRQLANVRLTTAITFGGVSGPSQLNKLAEQLVQEHWDWSRAAEDSLAASLTLSAFAYAVEKEAFGLAALAPSLDIATMQNVSHAIWDQLEQRGLVDMAKVETEMPTRIQARIDAMAAHFREEAEGVIRRLKSEEEDETPQPISEADAVARSAIETARLIGAKTPRDAAEITAGRPLTDQEWEKHKAAWESNW